MSFIYKVVEVKDLNKKETAEFMTDCWQSALDSWTFAKFSNNIPCYILVSNETGQVLNKQNFPLYTEKDMKFWSEYLINNDYNRIEKRLILEDFIESQSNKDGYDLSEYSEEIEIENAFIGHIEIDKLDFHGNFQNMSSEDQDQIINPKHYKIVPKEAYQYFPDGLEYMDIMQFALDHHSGVEAHLLGQIFKYSFRIGKKDDKLQDAKKIEWYAKRLAEVISND